MSRFTFSTPLGTCAIAWSETGLVRFELPEAKPAPGDAPEAPAHIAAIVGRVRLHLGGAAQDFADLTYCFELVPEFARAVYRATLAIKAGRTASYGDIAAALGQGPAASRAVGSALGSNPWPLLIPCHRVVAADGHMTGFSGPGGVRTKLKLLTLEGSELFAE